MAQRRARRSPSIARAPAVLELGEDFRNTVIAWPDEALAQEILRQATRTKDILDDVGDRISVAWMGQNALQICVRQLLGRGRFRRNGSPEEPEAAAVDDHRETDADQDVGEELGGEPACWKCGKGYLKLDTLMPCTFDQCQLHSHHDLSCSKTPITLLEGDEWTCPEHRDKGKGRMHESESPEVGPSKQLGRKPTKRQPEKDRDSRRQVEPTGPTKTTGVETKDPEQTKTETRTKTKTTREREARKSKPPAKVVPPRKTKTKEKLKETNKRKASDSAVDPSRKRQKSVANAAPKTPAKQTKPTKPVESYQGELFPAGTFPGLGPYKKKLEEDKKRKKDEENQK